MQKITRSPAGTSGIATGIGSGSGSGADTNRGSADAPASWQDIEATLLARSLTVRPTEEASRAVDQPAEATTEARLHNARRILDRLEAHSERLRGGVRPGDPQLQRLMRSITDGDRAQLASLGIDADYAWLDDVLTALVSGTPFVEIETIGASAAHHLDHNGALDVRVDNLPADERAGILLAEILRDAFDGIPNVRIVALLDDVRDNLSGRELPATERDRYVVQMGRILFEHGVLRRDDVPGEDYVLLRESATMRDVDSLTELLADSGRGVVDRDDDGDVTFWPSEDFIAQLALDSAGRRKEFSRRGIGLRRGGHPTFQAIDAASFLNPVNRDVMHVVMLDARLAAQQDKTYSLLRAVEMVRQDTYHNVFYDADRLSPEAIALVVCQLLIDDLQRLIALLGRFDEWESFDADEYRERNYGQKVLPEDEGVIDFIVDELADLALEPVKRAIDVGAGPNLYPSMLIAPYIATDGSIILLDYASANLSSLEESLRGVGTTESPWSRFEAHMSQRDPRYAGVAARLPQLCRVEHGSIYDLPTDAYDIVTSFFVAESITTSRREFRVAIRALRNAVRVGGVLVVTHMVGSLGYHAGEGTRFPAVRLLRHDLEEACRDADLDFAMHLVSHDEQARDGYQGMAAIVARRLR